MEPNTIPTETKTISLRRGRPTKYTQETPRRVIAYIKKCQQNNEFITIEQLASELGVGTRSLYGWEKEYGDFLRTMDMLRDAQRDQLLRGGITNKYNARFASFLLKANHGMQDKQPLVNATQNNSFNGVTPELMAEAIRMTREKDPSFLKEDAEENVIDEEAAA